MVEPVLEPLAEREPKNLRVDLPPGLMVNPEATPKCSLLEFNEGELFPGCKPETKIGEVKFDIVTTAPGVFSEGPKGRFVTELLDPRFTQVDLFNLEPSQGEPALFGLRTLFGTLLLRTEIEWTGDFHTSFTIRGVPVLGDFGPLAIHSVRLLTLSNLGDGTLATLPTTCFDPAQPQFSDIYSSWIRMDSVAAPVGFFPFGALPVEAPLPPGLQPEGCEGIPFDPSIEVDPGTDAVDSAASPTVTTRMPVQGPRTGGGPVAQSHLRSAEVTLPTGMALNPAGSAGLAACDDFAFKKREPELQNECPDASIVGTAEIKTPLLGNSLKGTIHLGVPRSNDPASGDQFRIFVEAKDHNRGVIVRLIGNVKADPKTGQLTARFDDQLSGALAGPLPRGLPQVPFESLTLRFDRANKVFTSRRPTCSRTTTTARMEPWARPGTHVSLVSRFTLVSDPGNGPCPQTLGERPFAPPYAAKPDTSQGGAFSPFRVQLVRPEGQQELKGLNVTLPRGVIGKLAGIPYCSEAAIAAASGNTGVAERSAPELSVREPGRSTSTEAGTGARTV